MLSGISKDLNFKLKEDSPRVRREIREEIMVYATAFVALGLVLGPFVYLF